VGNRADVAGLQADGPPDVRSVRPDVSAETAELLLRFMSSDRSKRPQTWDAALAALDGRLAPDGAAARRALWQRTAAVMAAHPVATSLVAAAPLVAAAAWLVNLVR
jgi:hypothetical protein